MVRHKHDLSPEIQSLNDKNNNINNILIFIHVILKKTVQMKIHNLVFNI